MSRTVLEVHARLYPIKNIKVLSGVNEEKGTDLCDQKFQRAAADS